jgi:hypothetical protein
MGFSADGEVEAVLGMLADPVSRDELYHHTFVYPEQRLLYVETPKAACTSMKVALLGLTGSTLEDLPQGKVPRRIPEAIVHDRRAYPAKSLVDLGRDELVETLTAPGWMRFCVIRNPFARTFSAWEDKVFLGDALLFNRFRPQGDGDRFVEGALDVRATFGVFVKDLFDRRREYFSDVHFRPQARVIAIGALPYTDVVRLDELDSFRAELEAHVSRPIALPRLNEGLGMNWDDNYDAEAIERVSDLYAEDLALFGFPVPAASEGHGARLDRVATNLLNVLRMRVRQVAALREQT